MTRKVRPFEPQKKGYTIIDNVVFDYILPELTANGWKVLCFIIRKTKGWQKEWDGLSYSQIMKGTGIKSSATISKVLTELMGDHAFLNKITMRSLRPLLWLISLGSEVRSPTNG